METNEPKNTSLETYTFTAIAVYIALFAFYIIDTTTGLQPIVKDGHSFWANTTVFNKEYEPYQQLKASSYILLFLWIGFYILGLFLYVLLCQQGFDVIVSPKMAIYVKAAIGYLIFILVPVGGLMPVNSTSYNVLEGIGVIWVAILGLLPKKQT